MPVVFDAGGVLLRWEPHTMADKAFSSPEMKDRFFSEVLTGKLWKLYDAGIISAEDILHRAEEEKGIPRNQMIRFFEIVRESITPKYDTIALAEELLRGGEQIFVLSNMPIDLADYVRESYSFWEIFHGVVFSGYIQMAKPDKEIFTYLTNTFGLTPGETVFIDDTQVNIAAAKKLGFHAVYFEDAASCREHLMRYHMLMPAGKN